MANITLRVDVDCYYCTNTDKDGFFCMYHQKWYKSFSKCNRDCVVGAAKVAGIEDAVNIVIENWKRKVKKHG